MAEDPDRRYLFILIGLGCLAGLAVIVGIVMQNGFADALARCPEPVSESGISVSNTVQCGGDLVGAELGGKVLVAGIIGLGAIAIGVVYLLVERAKKRRDQFTMREL
jgi:hypothetical protein